MMAIGFVLFSIAVVLEIIRMECLIMSKDGHVPAETAYLLRLFSWLFVSSGFVLFVSSIVMWLTQVMP